MLQAMDVKRGFALHDRIEQAFAIIPQPHSLSVLADEDRQTRSLGSRRGRESGPNRTGSKLDWRLEASNKSRQVWKRLPAPVLELVLQHLNQIHLDRQSPSCTTCYMRDLISVQRTCKAWFSSAQKTL